jgi:hypothetical protein
MATRNTLVVLSVILIGLCVFVAISAYKTRAEARAALNDFRELGTSGDPTASFELLRRKYGKKLHAIEGCTQQLCQYEMSLSNGAISTLRVVAYVSVQATACNRRDEGFQLRTADNMPNILPTQASCILLARRTETSVRRKCVDVRIQRLV